jgi:hypothetical protein
VRLRGAICRNVTRPWFSGYASRKRSYARKTVDDALAVIESVDADDRTSARKTCDHALHRVRRRRGDRRGIDRVDVDADRYHRRLGATPASHHGRPVRARGFLSPEVDHGRAEAVEVAIGLECNEVEVHQCAHQLAVDRQRAQGFDVRKRDVKEEAQSLPHAELAQ